MQEYLYKEKHYATHIFSRKFPNLTAFSSIYCTNPRVSVKIREYRLQVALILKIRRPFSERMVPHWELSKNHFIRKSQF